MIGAQMTMVSELKFPMRSLGTPLLTMAADMPFMSGANPLSAKLKIGMSRNTLQAEIDCLSSSTSYGRRKKKVGVGSAGWIAPGDALSRNRRTLSSQVTFSVMVPLLIMYEGLAFSQKLSPPLIARFHPPLANAALNTRVASRTIDP